MSYIDRPVSVKRSAWYRRSTQASSILRIVRAIFSWGVNLILLMASILRSSEACGQVEAKDGHIDSNGENIPYIQVNAMTACGVHGKSLTTFPQCLHTILLPKIHRPKT